MLRLCLLGLVLLVLPHSLEAKNRLISLSPVITEIIYALGSGNDLVAVTTECNFPKQAQHLAKIGDFRPNLERILELKPTLVLGLGNSNLLENKLTTLGVHSKIFHSPPSLNSVFVLINDVAQLLNKPVEAATLIKTIKSEITEPIIKNKPRVLMVLWSPPITSVNKNTFISELIELAGGENVVDGFIDFPTLNSETILDLNPDIVLVNHVDLMASVKNNSGINYSKAGQTGKILLISQPDLVSRAGPRVGQGIAQLRQLIHP